MERSNNYLFAIQSKLNETVCTEGCGMILIAADRFTKYHMIVFDILFRIQAVKV